MRLTLHGWAAALAAAAGLGMILAGSLALAAATAARGDAAGSQTDWFQWRGPNRTGISTETGWRTNWTQEAPKTIWKASVGIGYSSMSVAKGKVYTMGNADGKDTVWCFDATDGKVVWQQSYACGDVDHPGPRCTPTVDGKTVYTLSQAGDLCSFDADTGKVNWNVNVTRQFGARKPQWGFACSPLVLGTHLIVDVGPILALDKATGRPAWRGGTDPAGYASPYAFKLGGATCIASFNESGPIVVSAADGKVLGRSPWKTSYGVNAVTPIVEGGTMFISSGYDRGAAVFEMAPSGLKTVWENKNMRNHANNCVLWNGFLYGLDGQVDQGNLTCIEYKTGEKKWSEGSVKAGALILADGKLICMSSRGELVAAEASPEKFKELGRTKVLGGTCWTAPVLSGGRIYCRNHPGELLCLDVRGK
jgi:outer membrane protein assembly factor BamB